MKISLKWVAVIAALVLVFGLVAFGLAENLRSDSGGTDSGNMGTDTGPDGGDGGVQQQQQFEQQQQRQQQQFKQQQQRREYYQQQQDQEKNRLNCQVGPMFCNN